MFERTATMNRVLISDEERQMMEMGIGGPGTSLKHGGPNDDKNKKKKKGRKLNRGSGNKPTN